METMMVHDSCIIDDTTNNDILHQSSQQQQQQLNVILVIDVGSSSIRCTAYDCMNETTDTSSPTLSKIVASCNSIASYQYQRKSIEPYTGHILIDIVQQQQQQQQQQQPMDGITSDNNTTTTNNDNLFDSIDHCIDQVLEQLHTLTTITTTNNTTPPTTTLHILAVGFTTFVMNFIGVNQYGIPLGNHITMSYACQTSIVQNEVQSLQSLLQQSCDTETLYQSTGVPIHSSYALPQLRIWYRNNNNNNNNNTNHSNQNHQNENNDNNSTVYQWATIASICIHRWSGGGNIKDTTTNNTNSNTNYNKLPISYSEASWTGLLNVHTCQYESYIFNHDLLPIDCINALPNIIDYDTIPYYFISSNNNIHNPYEERWPILFHNHNNNQNPQTRIFLSIGDGACANIGSKCTNMNRIACTIGTSAAARVCIEYPILLQIPQIQQQQDQQQQSEKENDDTEVIMNQQLLMIIPYGLFCYRIDRYHILLGGALTDGGNIIEWIMNHLFVVQQQQQNNNQSIPPTTSTVSSVSLLQSYIQEATQSLQNDYEDYLNSITLTSNESSLQSSTSVSEVSNKKKQSSSNLMVIPFFSGERNIGYRINSTGAMIGLTLQTRPYHIVKACLVGITLRLYAIIQLIQTTIEPLLVKQQQQRHQAQHLNDNDHTSTDVSMMILCSGKALEMNVLWRTMIADCTGIPVQIEEQTYEGTSRGVAILIQNALFRTIRSDTNGSCSSTEGRVLEQRISEGTINNRYIDEDIDDTVSSTTTAMTVQPNPNVKEYWESLATQQEAIINALSTTLQWK